MPIRHFREDKGVFGHFDVAVAVLMAAISFLTFGLDKAMLAGFLAYSFRQALLAKGKVNPYLAATTLLLALSTGMQWLWK